MTVTARRKPRGTKQFRRRSQSAMRAISQISPEEYIESLLWIVDKDGNELPFVLNNFQHKYIKQKQQAMKEGYRRFLVLKSRRGGITTLEQAYNFNLIHANKNKRAVTLADTDENTQKIFEIARRFGDRMPQELWDGNPKSITKAIKETYNRSRFTIGTAGSLAFGRGDTLHRVHGSEVAWWRGNEDSIKNLLAGLSEACSEGTITLETTPHGMKNWFYNQWRKARNKDSEWYPIFMVWWDDDDNKVHLTPSQKKVIVDTLTEEENLLISLKGLTPEQIAWRRIQQNELSELFVQEYPEDDVSCFLSSMACFFVSAVIRELLPGCVSPVRSKVIPELQIWKEPEAGKTYAIGADTAEGVATGDFSCAYVIDTQTLEQVAVLHGHWSTRVFAELLAKVGKYYSTALLAVERNNHGHAVLDRLYNDLSYSNLYYTRRYDKRKKHEKVLGFDTNNKTRFIMLNSLKDYLEDLSLVVNDSEFLAECLSFCDNGTGKFEAEGDDMHDDRVMACGIGLTAALTVNTNKGGSVIWG